MTTTSSPQSRLFQPPKSGLEINRRLANSVAILITTLFLCFVVGLLFYLIFYVLGQGVRYLNLNFFTQIPTPNGEPGGGMAQSIIGTLLLVGLGSVIGIPLGLFTGIYLSEFGGNAFASSVRFLVDVMAGVPTIIFGLFIWGLIVVPSQTFSGIAGGCALGIVMIPIVARTTEDVLHLVPQELREASLALGATKARTILRVVIPAAISGIITGIILAMARIAGETAPLLMTAFGTNFWNTDMTQPVDALPLRIFQFAGSPYQEQVQQGYTGSFILILLIVLASFIVRWSTGGFRATARR